MMVVVGNLDILVDELGTPGTLHRFTSAIRSAATEASDLSVRLLATAGTAHIHPQSYTISMLVRILDTATRQSTVSGASITTTVDSDCRHITVSVDPDYMKVAVAGLVSNAVEAYPDDTSVKQVALHFSVTQWEPTPGAGAVDGAGAGVRHSTRLEAGRYMSLSVQDRAGGVPPDTFDHLFEPFFSTGFLGRGLGLSAVAGVAKQHGGGVIVETRCGHGTTVTIMIPVEESLVEDSGR
jgi:signal transduction histidine kinase